MTGTPTEELSTSTGTEGRVAVLEAELVRFAEAFQELASHYATLHNFMLQQFGDTFKQFVLAEGTGDVWNDEQDTQNEGDEAATGTDETYQECQDGEVEGRDAVDGEFDEGELITADPTDMLDVTVQDDTKEASAANETEVTAPTNQAGPSGSRTGPSFNQGQVLLVRRAVHPQSNVQLTVMGTSIQFPTIIRTARAPPPPLRRVLPAGSIPRAIIAQQSSSRVQLGAAAPSSVVIRQLVGGNRHRTNEVLLRTDDEDFRAGKYAKFYRKVDEELIQCKMCHKVLKRRGKFIQHLRTHTGEKPFKCEYCPAAFSRKDNMNVHVAKHHPPNGNSSGVGGNAKPMYGYQCEYCSKLFANENIYSAHVRLVHSTEEIEEEEETNGDYATTNDGDEDFMEQDPLYFGDEDGSSQVDYYVEDDLYSMVKHEEEEV